MGSSNQKISIGIFSFSLSFPNEIRESFRFQGRILVFENFDAIKIKKAGLVFPKENFILRFSLSFPKLCFAIFFVFFFPRKKEEE